MLSGVKAQVGIKLYGDDLNVLRRTADEMKAAIAGRAGRHRPDGRAASRDPAAADSSSSRASWPQYGLTLADVNEFIETAMNGRVVSEVLQGAAEV